jgi:transposase
MFHRTDESILGHCFVCFLGLLLLSLLVRELMTKELPMSIPKLIDILDKIKLTRISIPGRKKDLYKVDKMEAEVKRVYDALELERFL